MSLSCGWSVRLARVFPDEPAEGTESWFGEFRMAGCNAYVCVTELTLRVSGNPPTLWCVLIVALGPVNDVRVSHRGFMTGQDGQHTLVRDTLNAVPLVSYSELDISAVGFHLHVRVQLDRTTISTKSGDFVNVLIAAYCALQEPGDWTRVGCVLGLLLDPDSFLLEQIDDYAARCQHKFSDFTLGLRVLDQNSHVPPMILRFFSGSLTPLRRLRNSSAPSTTVRLIPR